MGEQCQEQRNEKTDAEQNRRGYQHQPYVVRYQRNQRQLDFEEEHYEGDQKIQA